MRFRNIDVDGFVFFMLHLIFPTFLIVFRHQGNTRTFKHNLSVASLLSFVAGLVNVVGFLSVQRLTTNVTGHFAFFVDEMIQFNFNQGLIFFLYTVFFLLGSFFSNFIIEVVSRKETHIEYIVPVILESIILFLVAFAGNYFIKINPDILAFSLLFSMGMQNSLVTKISNATVRTTHLTGLFTDLGIELSQLFFYKEKEQITQLKSSIKLRMTIISFFFVGGVVGGVLFTSYQIKVLYLASFILIGGLLFEDILLKLGRLNQKIKQNIGK